MAFEIGDGGFGFGAFRADKPEGEDVDRRTPVVEQTFVAVADLLDVERLVADPLGHRGAAGPHLDGQQGVEDGQDGPVVDSYRAPEATVAFEEGEPVGVKQAPAVGGKGEAVVVGTAVDGPEGGEEPVPGRGPALQGVLAVAGGDHPQVVAQGEHRVGLRPQVVLGR